MEKLREIASWGTPIFASSPPDATTASMDLPSSRTRLFYNVRRISFLPWGKPYNMWPVYRLKKSVRPQSNMYLSQDSSSEITKVRQYEMPSCRQSMLSNI